MTSAPPSFGPGAGPALGSARLRGPHSHLGPNPAAGGPFLPKPALASVQPDAGISTKLGGLFGLKSAPPL
ncbi:hypothetical protein Pyn_21958 [Prunus yedoensis var. nudiflora]|uniref:Uncharacterized protein n=1 Tax=Prunus yedoensis var. nudiflora TaxID=2094558 RepID=A0A314ZHB3_PRUYE|nr:hypothetical protein Pyn_21958 [Prunus yedoensis var. nudiflora]